MKKINVAINGFGRIGRTFLRKVFLDESINIVAINDLTAPATLAHLLKYDSIHGKFPATVEAGENHIIVNGKKIEITAEKDPSLLPWEKLNVEVVLESTGKFTKEEDAKKHITAGAKKVIISAPATGNIKSIVIGVNENTLDGSELVISNASCTTNNAAPMIKVLKELVKIDVAYISTVHSYTSDQRLHDSPHKDLRRARAAANSIIPTSTGAAKAITKIFPDLDGKITGGSVRVPVLDGSMTEMTIITKDEITVEQINTVMKNAALGSMKGILGYTEDPIVSVDVIGSPYSCLFDSELTLVFKNLIKVVGWYDNEAGYSHRLIDFVRKFN
jgi:glyceraldehyde 3-phosphate dehydrogenase